MHTVTSNVGTRNSKTMAMAKVLDHHECHRASRAEQATCFAKELPNPRRELPPPVLLESTRTEGERASVYEMQVLGQLPRAAVRVSSTGSR